MKYWSFIFIFLFFIKAVWICCLSSSCRYRVDTLSFAFPMGLLIQLWNSHRWTIGSFLFRLLLASPYFTINRNRFIDIRRFSKQHLMRFHYRCKNSNICNLCFSRLTNWTLLLLLQYPSWWHCLSVKYSALKKIVFMQNLSDFSFVKRSLPQQSW